MKIPLSKIALSTHLLAYHPFQLDFADLIREVGFSTVEMWCMNPHFPYRDLNWVERTRQRFEKVGINANSVHLPFYLHLELLKQRKTLSPLDKDEAARELALQEAEAAIEAASLLGAKVAVLHLGETGALFEPENETLALKAIERLGKKAAEKQITIALENLLSKLTEIDKLRYFIQKTGMKQIGICVDVGHSQVWKNPIEDVRQAAELLRNTHLHDNDGHTDQHRPPGQGTINWRELSAVFLNLGYEGYHSLEIRDESRGGEEPNKLLAQAASATHRAMSDWGENAKIW